MATAAFARRLGEAVMKAGAEKSSSWFSPHMAAASRAILERIPMVDFTLEVRDARIPMSSRFGHMRNFSSSRRIIVLNKIGLADRSRTREWIKYFEEQNCMCYGTNCHNKENIREFLNFLQLQARVRELKFDGSKFTTTIMLVGIPNVGKSALANSLHQIGRISAAEKGKLKHATVSPLPGETKDINSLKIASHPNIYVLDTSSVLLPDMLDIEMGSKLALTGAINDSLIGECELARYFLSILYFSDEYKRWESLASMEDYVSSIDVKQSMVLLNQTQEKRSNLTLIIHRILLYGMFVKPSSRLSSFSGNLEDENVLPNLTEAQIMTLREAFRVPLELGNEGRERVCTKLLNLYRTGRLGHYTFDIVPRNFY